MFSFSTSSRADARLTPERRTDEAGGEADTAAGPDVVRCSDLGCGKFGIASPSVVEDEVADEEAPGPDITGYALSLLLNGLLAGLRTSNILGLKDVLYLSLIIEPGESSGVGGLLL